MIKIALFGIHKFLSETLFALESQDLFPQIVILPTVDSIYHTMAEEFCIKHKIAFARPHSVNDPEFITFLKRTSVNRIIVTGYNEIFSNELLSVGTMGAVNCHGGLLPEERGPVPYKWAIYDGRKDTGVTYHQMTEKLDQGKFFVKNRIPICETDTNQDLFEKVCIDASKTIPIFFNKLNLDELVIEEDGSAIEIGKYKGQIPERLTHFDLSLPVDELSRRVRAFSPRPGVFLTENNGRRLLITSVSTDLGLINSIDMVFQVQDGQIAITGFEVINN